MVEADQPATNPSAEANQVTKPSTDSAMLDQTEEEKQSTGEHSSNVAAPDSAPQTTILDAHANMRELTNYELIKKAEEYAENLKLEKAVSLLDEGTRRFPNETLIMDQYTDLLI